MLLLPVAHWSEMRSCVQLTNNFLEQTLQNSSSSRDEDGISNLHWGPTTRHPPKHWFRFVFLTRNKRKTLSLILLILLVWFHVFIASYRVISEKEGSISKHVCLYLFIYFIFLQTQDLGKITLKKEHLSAGIWTLRAANGSTLSALQIFHLILKLKCQSLKKISFNIQMLKKTLFLLYLYLLTCLAFISKGCLNILLTVHWFPATPLMSVPSWVRKEKSHTMNQTFMTNFPIQRLKVETQFCNACKPIFNFKLCSHGMDLKFKILLNGGCHKYIFSALLNQVTNADEVGKLICITRNLNTIFKGIYFLRSDCKLWYTL